ncbi:hypothetical protein PG996_013862 [Apiospora saccharicola]|uniref:MBL fold metallo-hydrolase n=1 Tax=Apiospora saccharicola TaxID=335842 RepID=A0ABR1TJE9_9PEZI
MPSLIATPSHAVPGVTGGLEAAPGSLLLIDPALGNPNGTPASKNLEEAKGVAEPDAVAERLA